jgi:tetratricopeptide (TPR) repeat protein
MSESKEIKNLSVLADVSEVQQADRKRPAVAGVRVSPGSYLALASVITFLSVLLLRSQYDAMALVLVGVAWIIIPILAVFDRIVFDGLAIRRQGLGSFVMESFFGRKRQLAISDFETVETNAVRTLRRRGTVRYRYRTQITGKGKDFVIASGGKAYRRLMREILPLIHEDKLDNRSRDLRDYLSDPGFVNKKTQLSQLASEEILDVATTDFKLGGKNSTRSDVDKAPPLPEDLERAHLLRRLGNELRVAGRLREAGEAFRRALNVTPRAAWLIYDFARLLRSQASAQADARLLQRARAALRLASIRAENDLVLLPLIGESFLECGDARNARQAFQRVVDLDNGNFKARLGLADLALRDGKLAHVIHHYHEAARVSSEQALTRYARREGDYYMLLNDDEEYLSNELRRINWLQHVTRVRRLSSRVINAGILVALIGGFLDPVAGSVGWSLASSALVVWLLTLLGTRMLFSRSKPRPVT